MKNLKTAVLNEIFRRCKSLKIYHNKKGYVKFLERNLIEIFDNWSIIQQELASGQGNELKCNKNGVIKFCAIHSSSALFVNTFAPFKDNIEKFSFNKHKNFTKYKFEEKLPTGISCPNLDFYLESDNTIIGFESKFTEYLTPKLPNHGHNLEKYYERKELSFLTKDFHSIIGHYCKYNENMFLDVAQLLKHSIGLINKGRNKFKSILNKINFKPTLVYLYWQPNNWYEFELFNKHYEEINEFKNLISGHLNFIPLSYNGFWQMYENDFTFGKHIQKLKKRYSMDLIKK